MTNAIGIDFGTSRTMVSYLDSSTGRVELVTFGCDRFVPTTVHIDEKGQYLFGKDADELIATDPEGYCRAFKLHLAESDPILPRAGATAEDLAKRFLGHIKEECEQNVFHGEPIGMATITVPVSFSPARKAALKRAAEAAGFAKVSFLPEPEAAGIAFLRDNPTDKFSRALVLDWGGGTLDIAIISRDEDGTIHADSHCAEGRDDVGGEEMDRRLLEDISAKWKTAFRKQLLNDELDGVRFLRKSQETKEKLSQKSTAPFWGIPPQKIDVTRERFSQLIDEMLDSAVDLIKSALAKNKKRGNPAPDAILLIGGTSQVPAVREAMETNFPQLRVLSWHHSHEAVALGATVVDAAANPQKNMHSTEKNTNRNHKTSPRKNRGHFDVVCPHCGSIEDVTGKGRWKCDNCGKPFDVDSRSHVSIPKEEEGPQADYSGKCFEEALSRAGELAENNELRKLKKCDADIIAKAAENGNIRAAAILGRLYSEGSRGYQVDNGLAINWMTIAANAGDNDSQAILALWSLGGENSPAQKNRSNALKWSEMAYDGNRSLKNQAILLIVLSSFEDPDKTRIRRIGQNIDGKVADKAPEEFSTAEQVLLGIVYSSRAVLAMKSGNYEKARQFLQKGADFGNQESVDALAELDSEANEEENASEITDKRTNLEKEVNRKPKKNSYTDPNDAALSGAAIGAVIGTIIPGAGTLAGAGIGAIAGRLKAWWDNL
ncbi:MAG: Hsp70 family protein [Kiritimatiellae bacterium]|nr:Hsp70 family protein [Kiritimatiellia bacterium]